MKIWILVAWILSISFAVFGILNREQLLHNGVTVYVALNPPNPNTVIEDNRILLDYALLNAVTQAQGKSDALLPHEQTAVIRLDAHKVASFVRLHGDEPLAADEQLLRFQNTASSGKHRFSQISTHTFFFQRDRGRRFREARYGEFRVRQDGRALLVRLLGDDLLPL